MSSTEIPPALPAQNLSNVSQENEKDTERGVSSYFVIGIMVIILLVLIYFAYTQFISNRDCDEAFVKGQTQERSDTAADYNLRDEIKQLDFMQSNMLKKLSNDIGL